MADRGPHRGSRSTEIVPWGTDHAGAGVPGEVLTGTDLAVGAATRAAHLAMQIGGAGWGATSAVAPLVSAQPGADRAGRGRHRGGPRGCGRRRAADRRGPPRC